MANVDEVKFFRLDGYWSPQCKSDKFSDDGVHLNKLRNKTYYYNIRAVAVSAQKSM
jgi:hypothetical protein